MLEAIILYSYDRESLIYMSGHVVEGVIGKKSKQNKYEVWNATEVSFYRIGKLKDIRVAS